MNEIQAKFDYTEVAPDIADKLHKHEATIKGIQSKAIFEIGTELQAAHDELANYHGGTFYSWCESIGIGIGTVKNIMNYHELVSKNFTNRTMLEELPKSLVYAAAKPSAPPELTQKVLDGEITTHKQWQKERKALQDRVEQAEARAEQAEQENATLTEQYNAQAKELQDLRDNPTVVEVLPPDYNEIKTGYDTLQSKYRNLQSTNESYAKTNESLRRKLAEAKAHENGMSLQELAEEDKAFSQYIKSKHEEAEDAKKFGEALSKLDMLTDNEAEVRELCRCYLAHKATEANRAFVMKSTAQKIRLNIKKLEAALSIFEQGKLSVIK